MELHRDVIWWMMRKPGVATSVVVRVFSDVLVAFSLFLYLANIRIWKSHLNIREGSDYLS